MKNFLLICFTIFLSILAALAVGELIFRIFKPQVTFSSIIMAYDFHCFEKGTYYPIQFKKNAECLLRSTTNSFADVYITTNSLGLRNPEIDLDKKKDTTRLLFVGDSYTAGWGVKEQEAFPRQTEQLLQQAIPDKKIEVINAGLPTAGPGYYYLYLKNNAMQLKPDYIIVGFYLMNDITDNTLNSEWKDLDPNGMPTRIESTKLYVDNNGNFYPVSLPWRFKIPILRDSHLISAFATLFDKQNTEIIETNVINPQTCLFKKTCHDLDKAKEQVKKLFLGMKAITEKNNTKLIVAVIPSEIQLNRYARSKYGIKIPLLPSERELPFVEFATFFKENKIDYIDLHTLFPAETKEDQYYFKNDDHWNVKGHQIAAQAIAKSLLPSLSGKQNEVK